MGTTHRYKIQYDDYDTPDIDYDLEKRRKSEQWIYDNTSDLNNYKVELEKVNRKRRKI